MHKKNFFLILLLTGVAGCAGDNSLQGTFEQQMKEDEVDGFNIIHIEENGSQGLVLYTSWTEKYPENKNRPGIRYYEKQDSRWEGRPGTDCSSDGIARLGLMGNGNLYCATLKENMDFEKVLVGGTEAKIFQATESQRVWFAITDDRNSKVRGIKSDGSEIALN